MVNNWELNSPAQLVVVVVVAAVAVAAAEGLEVEIERVGMVVVVNEIGGLFHVGMALEY